MFKRLQQLLTKEKQSITVVSGLPRSGTSMAMRMLEAGGIAPVTDKIRSADGDNPKGYYEFERVKKLPKGDVDWLADAEGKAVKVISMLLKHLPATYDYQVLFMRRALPEILASQQQMLLNRGEDPTQVGTDTLATLYPKHLKEIEHWLSQQPNFRVLYVDYNQMLTTPATVTAQICQFLDRSLDQTKMQAVVDLSLYRQRKES